MPVPGIEGLARASEVETPIKHVVVIFQENVSCDHYFGSYPEATNTSGQPFHEGKDVHVNGLYNTPGRSQRPGHPADEQPESRTGGNEVNPRRLDPSNINDVLTCDQDHNYNDEQKAFDGGLMDKFVTHGRDRVGQERHRPGLPSRRRHELLRRQLSYRPVELRQTFCDERQLVRDDVRPLFPRCCESDLRQHGRRGPDDQGGRYGRRYGQRRARRQLARLGCSAVLRRLLDARRGLVDRGQHRRRAQQRWSQLGLVPGRLPADH